AARAGMEEGDVVKKITTAHAILSSASAQKMQDFIAAHQNESLTFTVERKGMEVTETMQAASGVVPDKKVVGIEFGDVGILQLSFFEAIAHGSSLGWSITKDTAVGLIGFFGALFE